MATNTPNLNLVKPDLTDNVDIDDLNGNMDIIDGLGIEDLASSNITSPVEGDSLVYDGSDWVNAPKSGNAIINGDFGVWQRGTSFSTAGFEYTADRWIRLSGGDTVSRQSFTSADIEAVGYGDAEYFLRFAKTGGDTFSRMAQRIEDVRTFAGQQVTISFWAKGTNPSSGTGIRVWFGQDFGSGGSGIDETFAPILTLTGSWQRFTFTVSLPSIPGKTIGANNFLAVNIGAYNNSATYTLDLWGVQLEAGPVATPFKLAGGGSKAAELALCQRYYYRLNPAVNSILGSGYNLQTSVAQHVIPFPTTMRTIPTALEQSGSAGDYSVQYANTIGNLVVVPSFVPGTSSSGTVAANTNSVLTQGQGSLLRANGVNAFLAWSAEL
jgi:hypothetical protein